MPYVSAPAAKELHWLADPTERLVQEYITDRVRVHLKGQGRTWDWLAWQTGIKISLLRSRSYGRTRWSILDVYLLADALGVSLSELFPPKEMIT